MSTNNESATKTETETSDKRAPKLDPATALLRFLIARNHMLVRHLCDLADAISERKQLERSYQSHEDDLGVQLTEYRIAEALLAVMAEYQSTDNQLCERAYEQLCGARALGWGEDDIPF